MKSLPAFLGKKACIVAAWISLILAAIGTVVPLLPTVPFLLCGLWFSNKAGSGLSHWLRQHHKFGPLIDNWQKQRSLALSTKWLATAMLLFNLVALYFIDVSDAALVVTALCIGFILIYIHHLPTTTVSSKEWSG